LNLMKHWLKTKPKLTSMVRISCIQEDWRPFLNQHMSNRLIQVLQYR
jgi:hypothetical protein